MKNSEFDRIVMAARKYIESNDVKGEERYIAFNGFVNGAIWLMMNHWLNVKDDLPNNGAYAFVRPPMGGVPVAARYENGKWRNAHTNTVLEDVTHWMSLPPL